MNRLYGKHVILCIVTGALLSLGPQVSAQQSPKPAAPSTQAKLSDKELNAFVKAYVDYHRIRQQYEPALQATKDPEKRKRIQDEANNKIKEALARQQFTVQEYNRVFELVNKDEQLRQKTLRLVEKERKKG